MGKGLTRELAFIELKTKLDKGPDSCITDRHTQSLELIIFMKDLRFFLTLV